MSIPPLHAVAVHLPITLIPLALAADWIALRRGSANLRQFALWLLFLGWVGTGLAIAFGYIDMARVMRNPPTQASYPYILLHAKIAWITLPLVTALFIWRWQISLNRVTHHRLYLAAASAVVGLTLFEAWYGGELVYTLGVGAGPTQSVTNAAEAQKAFDRVHTWVTYVPGMSTHAPPPPSGMLRSQIHRRRRPKIAVAASCRGRACSILV